MRCPRRRSSASIGRSRWNAARKSAHAAATASGVNARTWRSAASAGMAPGDAAHASSAWRTKYSALALTMRSANGGGWGQEEPWVVVERHLAGHALELLDGRDDVEDAEALDDAGMIERHPVRDPAAPVVPDHREPLEPPVVP